MSPIHVTSSQLISSEIFPVPVIKALLYPGAILNGLAKNMTFPKWESVLDIYNLTNVKEASAVPDLQRLEVRGLRPLRILVLPIDSLTSGLFWAGSCRELLFCSWGVCGSAKAR